MAFFSFRITYLLIACFLTEETLYCKFNYGFVYYLHVNKLDCIWSSFFEKNEISFKLSSSQTVAVARYVRLLLFLASS